VSTAYRHRNQFQAAIRGAIPTFMANLKPLLREYIDPYHWGHEPCWYAVRKGKKSNWRGDRTQSTVWEVKNLNPHGGNKDEQQTGHGTQKSVELMRRPILNHTERGDVVYDPFLGSGSTVIAAEQTERVCYGLDIDPKYIDVIVLRWQAQSGQKASLDRWAIKDRLRNPARLSGLKATRQAGSGWQLMAGFPGKLTHKQDEAIIALLTHRSTEEAARAVNVGVRTLYRWVKDADFEYGLRAARRTAFSQSVARLQQMCSAAVSTLGKVMVDPATPAATKVRAADSILDHSAKAIEIEDIEVRVTELERSLAVKPARKG
jgi:hypothetical protein